MDNQYIKKIVSRYLAQFPNEFERLAELNSFLKANDEVFSRSNYHGHVTTSAVVLNTLGNKALLIMHKKLSKYLQPGGHYENDISLRASASREVAEETGLSINALTALFSDDQPIDIDTHLIPGSPKRGEPAHYHFDFRYILTTDERLPFSIQEDEVTNVHWFGLEDAVVMNAFGPFLTSKLSKL